MDAAGAAQRHRTRMSELEETHVVTCFLRADGEILLLRRSGEVDSYGGAWGAVAGHVEGDPDASAQREIREETGFVDSRLVGRGSPFPVADEELGRRWIVHPYLFEVPRRDPHLNYESAESAWVSPVEILRRNVVPQLWDSYRAVAPTADAVMEDREHGSTYVSLRALEVLRDAAAERMNQGAVYALARELIGAQPAMAAVRNRINRAMRRSGERPASDRADAVHDVLRAAVEADRAAAREAARLAGGACVLTLSRSETVTEALLDAGSRVLITVSEPGGEGIDAARRLALAGLDVTLLPDAALGSAPEFDLVLLGCDTVLPDGAVINKVGSRLAALVARERSVPVYVATSVDKLLATGAAGTKQAARSQIGDVPEDVHVATEMFERVPGPWIDGFASEEGVLRPEDLAGYADAFLELAQW